MTFVNTLALVPTQCNSYIYQVYQQPSAIATGARSPLLLAIPVGNGRACSTMSAYKYQSQFASMVGCPPPCSPASGTVYRVVHKPIVARDLEPTAITKPDEPRSCGSWGISMFTTQKALQDKWGKLIGKYPNLANDVGDHIAEGSLVAAHGMITKPNKEKHFNLHEFNGPNLAPVFRVTVQIKIVPPTVRPT